MFQFHAMDTDVATGHRRCDHKRARLDPVRHDLIISSGKLGYSLDSNRVGAGALYLGAHAVQVMGQVYNFRFASSVLQQGFALCGCCGHHKMFGAPDGGDVEVYASALELAAFCFYIAMLKCYFGTKCLQAFQVQVDGARSDGTATRQ